jgi:hypothetical protein
VRSLPIVVRIDKQYIKHTYFSEARYQLRCTIRSDRNSQWLVLVVLMVLDVGQRSINILPEYSVERSIVSAARGRFTMQLRCQTG